MKPLFNFERIASVALTLFISGSASWAVASEPIPTDLPTFGSVAIPFEACSAEKHVVRGQLKVSNFSPYDLDLPSNHQWATVEEMSEVAAPVVSQVLGEHIARELDSALLDPHYVGDLTQREDTIHGDFGKGEGDYKVSVGTKVILLVKMALSSKQKYSAVSLNFDPKQTFANVSPHQVCR